MKKEILEFINKNELSPFTELKSRIVRAGDSIFKTTDAKAVFNKVVLKLSRGFVFNETSNIWNFFSFANDFHDVLKRQDFFKEIIKGDNLYLKGIVKPRRSWTPEYDIVVVTEDETTFFELQKLNCPVQLIVGENDLSDLMRYDVIQVIDSEMFNGVLERLPQSVFIDDPSNIYLERFLEELSGWRNNIKLLREYSSNQEILSRISLLEGLFDLIDAKAKNKLTIEGAEDVLEEINERINEKIKNMTLSGESLVKIFSEGKMPEGMVKIVNDSIDVSGMPNEIFNLKVPVELDYKELEGYIERQNANEFTNIALEIKRRGEELKKVPEILRELDGLLLFEDFCLGVSSYLSGDVCYPIQSENVHFEKIENYFLDKPSPIDFQLDHFSRCSILTGANSGGKTTLLEHVLQCISFFHLGLPTIGRVHMPVFLEVYYFAKNKGSASKGAFETLLTQMSKIKPGKKTLILADEIEAVTEPGIAGKIISATADFFIRQQCFLIIATHLGYEVRDFLPSGARIDGIEAKGLDEKYNLIVNHNPVMGRLAHSTPELIVERMASQNDDEYFQFLRDELGKGERSEV